MKLHWLSLMSGVTLLALTGISHAASYNLDHDGSGDCGTFTSNGRSSSVDPKCWSSEKTGQIKADELGVAANFDDDTLPVTYEAYKWEVGNTPGTGTESGYAAGFYTSVITTNSDQGETVTITFDGVAGQELNCPTCYFTVKDGAVADPSAILIELAGWNGSDTLVFNNIFNEIGSGDGGTISNFRILTTDVPLPAAAWLFGSGLIGLAGIAGKRRIA